MATNSVNKGSRIEATPFALGCACLLVAVVASFVLSLEHIGHLDLPGCGEDSRCAEVIAGRWGTVPGINWPVAFLGFAYFTGVLAAWLFSRRGLSWPLQQVVRLGAAISLGFIAIMIVEGTICPYCLVCHAANFGFWMLTERSRRPPHLSSRPILVLGAAFVVVSAIMGAVLVREGEHVARQQEGEFEAATGRIKEADKQRAESEGAATDEHDRPWSGGFTGRYRLGPAKAAARIVMLTDYQCPDCLRIEKEAMALVTENDNVSLSIKYFPMCTACNPHIRRNLHVNACWAARAAEAAGILQGAEGFFRMHGWLFSHKGAFSDTQLRAAIRELGFDEREFIALMTGQETLSAVRADIEEAIWLGLHYTPMIFVNERAVPRWRWQDAIVLDRILQKALQE